MKYQLKPFDASGRLWLRHLIGRPFRYFVWASSRLTTAIAFGWEEFLKTEVPTSLIRVRQDASKDYSFSLSLYLSTFLSFSLCLLLSLSLSLFFCLNWSVFSLFFSYYVSLFLSFSLIPLLFMVSMAIPSLFFFIFVFSIQSTVSNCSLKIHWCLNLNRGPLVSKATALPAEPEPQPSLSLSFSLHLDFLLSLSLSLSLSLFLARSLYSNIVLIVKETPWKRLCCCYCLRLRRKRSGGTPWSLHPL